MVDDVLREDEEQTIEVEKENYTIGFFPEGELEVTTNGTYNVSNYATTEVNVQPNLQQKSTTITTNGTQTITADSGYDGLSEAEVYISVPQPSGEVEITANGTYNVSDYETAAVNVSFESAYNVKIDGTLSYNTNGTGRSLITEVDLKGIAYTNMKSFFQNFNGLRTVTNIDGSSVTSFEQFFDSCSAMINAPSFDTSKATTTYMMFRGCSNLVNVPVYNLSSVRRVDYMFSYCSSLSNESLNNILASLLTATKYTETKTLSTLSLTQAQAAICTTLPNWAELEAKGWSTGY